MGIQAGTKLGRYEIQSLIGVGGMGEVYRALDTELNRPVALKFLPAEFALHPSRMKRFIQEARAASALNHPNIITVYEIGRVGEEENATPYFATEFIEGVTLKEHMARSRLKLADVLDIASQTASALVAAHAAGIVHRDIKPENIMVRHDGYIKVLDFGLAKPTERESSLIDTEAQTRAFVNTDPGTVMGTVSYMSPEQARGSQLDARTDIWSLGVVFYELLAGQLPFRGATPSHVIVSLLEDEPPPLSTYIADAPEALELIVEEALRKDREERTQTAKQLLGNLRRLRQRLDAGVDLDRSLSPSFASDPSAPRVTDARARGGRSAGERISRTLESPGKPTLGAGGSSAEYLISQIKQNKSWALLSLIAAILVAGAAAFGIYRLANRTGSGSDTAAMKITRLTNNGRAWHAAMSPDGKYVAHVLVTGDKQSLLLRQTATTSSREIVPPTTGYFLGVTFTPDGNHLYYVQGEQGKNVRALYQVSALGGDPRQLIYDVDSQVTFSPDGKRLAFIRGYFKEREKSLLIAGADGSGETKVATRKAPEFSRMDAPAWSPDGARIAFIVAGTDSEGYYVHVDAVGIEDKTESKVSADRWRNISSITWLSDGSGLLASARDRASIAGSPEQIWRIAHPGGDARRVTNDLNYYTNVSLATGLNNLVASVKNQEGHIWVATTGDSTKARRVSSNSFSGISGFAWAKDGRLVYTASERENRDIWISNADGSNEKQLTFETPADLFPLVTPDGRYIVFESNRGVGWGIWRMNIDGTNPIELVRNTREDGLPLCSADSRWVIYSDDAGGKSGLWKVSIDGGTPILITDKHLYSHALSPDGKQIAYYYRPPEFDSKLQIEIVPFEGGNPIKVLPGLGDGSKLRWSPDGTALDYIETREGASNIWRQPISGGEPRQITKWSTDLIFWFAWTPDGKELGCARGAFSSDLVLIEGLDVQ